MSVSEVSYECHPSNFRFSQTGRSDIPLTENGERIIRERAPVLVGKGREYMRTYGILIQHGD